MDGISTGERRKLETEACPSLRGRGRKGEKIGIGKSLSFQDGSGWSRVVTAREGGTRGAGSDRCPSSSSALGCQASALAVCATWMDQLTFASVVSAPLPGTSSSAQDNQRQAFYLMLGPLLPRTDWRSRSWQWVGEQVGALVSVLHDWMNEWLNEWTYKHLFT